MEEAMFIAVNELKQSIKVIGHGLRTLEKEVEGIQEYLEKERTIDRTEEPQWQHHTQSTSRTKNSISQPGYRN